MTGGGRCRRQRLQAGGTASLRRELRQERILLRPRRHWHAGGVLCHYRARNPKQTDDMKRQQEPQRNSHSVPPSTDALQHSPAAAVLVNSFPPKLEVESAAFWPSFFLVPTSTAGSLPAATAAAVALATTNTTARDVSPPPRARRPRWRRRSRRRAALSATSVATRCLGMMKGRGRRRRRRLCM